MPKAVPITSEDQARAGGCCLCPPGCMGIDPPDPATRAHFLEEYGPVPFIACVMECAWCYHGCAAPPGECGCARLEIAP